MSKSHFNLTQITGLAKLKIADTEIAAFEVDLDNILQLFNIIKAADAQGIEPMAHPMDLAQRLRPDVVTEVDQHLLFQSIAPAVENDLYLVPKVIGSD